MTTPSDKNEGKDPKRGEPGRRGQRGGDRGGRRRGRGGRDGAGEDKTEDFFADRKAAKEEFEVDRVFDVAKFNQKRGENAIQRGGRQRKAFGGASTLLGSAQAVVAAGDGVDDPRKHAHSMKMQLIDPDAQKKRAEKDKATIKYNFEDFLKQSQNLTE